jgi:ankyrin repeat protein
LASGKGHLNIVKELISRGANVNAANTNNGCTALVFACQEDHVEVIQELLKRGAKVNVTLSSDGFTPLMMASRNGSLDAVRLLLLGGANKTTLLPSGHNAYSIACGPHKAVLRALLKP